MTAPEDYMDPILERKEAGKTGGPGHHERNTPHEQEIEAAEKGALYGPFKMQYYGWFIAIIVIAFAALIIAASIWLPSN